MMVTDDERREVAERLRHSWPKIADESAIGRICRFHLAIYESIYADGGRHDFIELLDRLADLIEPSEGVKCVVKVDVDGERLNDLAYKAAVECAGVDREALLALADEITESYVASGADGDELVMSRGAVMFVARRIREACGEVVA